MDTTPSLNRMITALRAIKLHHIQLNELRGRNPQRSYTLSLVNDGLTDVPELSPPQPGDSLVCMLCTAQAPWGVFDTHTGAIVCVTCRDRARNG